MDSYTWKRIYREIAVLDRQLERSGRRPVYSDRLIVAMFVWSVAHDRPLCWACQRTSYGSMFRPRRLPSVSQFCRRMPTPRVQRMLEALHQRVARSSSPTDLMFLDARPLVVGACSKDPDARPGRVYGGFARGYKLHALVTRDERVCAWAVTSLNVSETTVAEQLLDSAQDCLADRLLLADGGYDSGALYDRVAAYGGQLLTPLPAHAGAGHRRQSSSRLVAAQVWRGIAGYVYKERTVVERCFAHQSAFGGGLGPLPPWVRGLPRVRRWVGAKLIVAHARQAVRRQAG